MTVIATGFGQQRRRQRRPERHGRAVPEPPVEARVRARASTSRRRCSTSRRSCATARRDHSRPWSALTVGGLPASSSIRPGADSPPDAAARASRRPGCADGAVRRLGDAGAVRGRDPGAPRRPPRTPARSTSRTWARSRSRGRSARELLQSLLSNELGRIEPGKAQYTLLTNERGGIVDDLIAYELDPFRFLLIVNASNRDADFAWLKEREVPRLGRPRRLRRVRADRRSGPACARAARPRPAAPAFTFAEAEVAGVTCMVNRTGYTGEEGVELLVMADEAGDAVGRGAGARGDAVRAGRARQPAARGLLPAARQRHRPGHRRDLGGPRLGLRARQGLHRRRRAAPGEGGGPGAASWPRS